MDDDALELAVRQVQGRVIIGFKDPTATDGVDNTGRVLASAQATEEGVRLLASLSATITYRFQKIPAVAATVPAGIIAELRRSPYIDYVEPSAPGQWANQVTPWGQFVIDAPFAHGYTLGSGVKILIIDSGIGPHRDLNVAVAWRCIDTTFPVADQYGHGTHVAGTAAALDNGVDVIGAAPLASLWSANVELGGFPDPAEVACSIDVARLNGIFVANMSFSLNVSTAVTDEINGGYNSDNMLFVASAGNSAGSVAYPASLSNVVAVSAIDSTLAFASFSNYGSQIELTAPGVNILSTSITSGSSCSSGGLVSSCSGTSMAAPHVTGAAALVKAHNPSWTNSQVRAHLNSTALDLGSSGRDAYFGFGLVNLNAALP